mmetsp:Transcript_4533/g.9379  ORF Transcript_4533/g.9379 Transcript_4533/m.9379 type:complete len:118 (-) Transcript_4533:288-641(-)
MTAINHTKTKQPTNQRIDKFRIRRTQYNRQINKYNTCATSNAYSSFLMAIIVEKSKKCLDFSLTLFVVHLLIVCVYGGFPSTWDWWIVHTSSVITMVLCGEYLCARREMEDIPLLQL